MVAVNMTEFKHLELWWLIFVFGSSIAFPVTTRLRERLDLLELRVSSEIRHRREDISELGTRLDKLAAINFTSSGGNPQETRHPSTSITEWKDEMKQVVEGLEATSRNNDIVISRFRDEQKTMHSKVERLRRGFRDEKARDYATKNELLKIEEKTETAVNMTKAILIEIEPIVDDLKMLKETTGSLLHEGRSVSATLSILSKATDVILLKLSDTERRVLDLASTETSRPGSCRDVLAAGMTDSGVYTIYPTPTPKSLEVYCDQTTDGGGWTVFQRREDGFVNFYRGWLDYRFGFGNVEGEFWLGNEYLHLLTAAEERELRVDMEDFEGEQRFARYSRFQVASRSEGYRLTVANYSGDAGDSLTYHNGCPFTTKDNDLDSYSRNCAVPHQGAWWYNKCHRSNLNAQYLAGKHGSYADGVNWYAWKGHHYSLKTTQMMLR